MVSQSAVGCVQGCCAACGKHRGGSLLRQELYQQVCVWVPLFSKVTSKRCVRARLGRGGLLSQPKACFHQTLLCAMRDVDCWLAHATSTSGGSCDSTVPQCCSPSDTNLGCPDQKKSANAELRSLGRLAQVVGTLGIDNARHVYSSRMINAGWLHCTGVDCMCAGG